SRKEHRMSETAQDLTPLAQADPWAADAAPAADPWASDAAPAADPWASDAAPTDAWAADATPAQAAAPDAWGSIDATTEPGFQLQQLWDGSLPLETWINQGLTWVVDNFRPFFQSV